MKIFTVLTLWLLAFGVQADHRHHNHGHYDYRFYNDYGHRSPPKNNQFLGIQLGDFRIGIGNTSRPQQQFKYSSDTRRHYHGNRICYTNHALVDHFSSRTEYYGDKHRWKQHRRNKHHWKKYHQSRW